MLESRRNLVAGGRRSCGVSGVAGQGKDGTARVDGDKRDKAVGENEGKKYLLHALADDCFYSLGRPRKIDYPSLSVIKDWLEKENEFYTSLTDYSGLVRDALTPFNDS